MTDEELYLCVPDPLWEQFKNGDRQAFAQLYNDHVDALLLYGMKVIQKQQIVEDTIQDLFVELWRSRENLQSVRSVSFYLIKSLRYKLFRHEKTRADYSMEDIPAHHPILQDSSIEIKILKEEEELLTREKVRRAIQRLPRRQQEVINLRFYQGFSNDQIAGIMDINYQSTGNLIHKAVLALRKQLGLALLLTILLFF